MRIAQETFNGVISIMTVKFRALSEIQKYSKKILKQGLFDPLIQTT